MHANIENKVAVVTGGSRGIGFRIAEKLIQNGASVLIGARNEADVLRATHALNELGPEPRAAGTTLDVRNYRQVAEFMGFAEREFGGIDILVNNAGIGFYGPVDQMPPEEWDAVIATNLNGAFYCVRAAIPSMKQRGGGYIFNISSLAGKNAIPGGAAYNASKFGLNGFSEALLLDLRYYNIRVSYIMPGSVETAFGRSGTRQITADSWKLAPGDVAQVVIDLLKFDQRAMVSRIEMRPSKPPRR